MYRNPGTPTVLSFLLIYLEIKMYFIFVVFPNHDVRRISEGLLFICSTPSDGTNYVRLIQIFTKQDFENSKGLSKTN